MTQEPSDDYLSRGETESWTWRVEESWGYGATPRDEGTRVGTSNGVEEVAPQESTEAEERGEYLGADPLDTEWARAWYTSEERSEDADTPSTPREGLGGDADQQPTIPLQEPGRPSSKDKVGAAPLASISLTPLAMKWEDPEELPFEREARLKEFWEENGKRVLVPIGLVLLLLVGVVLTVLNVLWATGA